MTEPAASTAPTWQPSPEELEQLGAAGRTFLAGMLEHFEASRLEGELLMEAAHARDAISNWRKKASTDKQAARLELQYTRTFANLLQALQVHRP